MLNTYSDDRSVERSIFVTSVPNLLTVREVYYDLCGYNNTYDINLYRGKPWFNASVQLPLKPWYTFTQVDTRDKNYIGYDEYYLLYDDSHRLFQMHLKFINGQLSWKIYDIIIDSTSDFILYSGMPEFVYRIFINSHTCDFNEEPSKTIYNDNNSNNNIVSQYYNTFDPISKTSYSHDRGNHPSMIYFNTDGILIREHYFQFGALCRTVYYDDDGSFFRSETRPQIPPTFYTPPDYCNIALKPPVCLTPFNDITFECCVCLGAEVGNDGVSMPCKHTGHKSCLEMWVNKKRTCPHCREKFY